MDIALLMKVAGVGLLISASTMILSKSGRDEQGMLLTITGIVVVMLMLAEEIGTLFDTVCGIFGLR